MCGRAYETYTDEELYFRYLNKRSWKWPALDFESNLKPNYNLCPTQMSFVLNVQDSKIGLRKMRWGLVPFWAKSVKDADKYSMINAKAEEIAEKRSFKAAFQKRRCIVPLTGFYEWKRTKDQKRPFAIFLKDQPIMSLAGIWEHWENSEDGEVVDSFSIVTTESNSFMEKIHNRMPVILSEKDEQTWLDPEVNDPKILAQLMKPCPSGLMSAIEVSTLVNSPRNNVPEVLKPL